MTQVGQQPQVVASWSRSWQGWPAFGWIGCDVPPVAPPWEGPSVALAPLGVGGLPPLELGQAVWALFERAAEAGGRPTSVELLRGDLHG